MPPVTPGDTNLAHALYFALLLDDVDAVASVLRQGMSPDCRLDISGGASPYAPDPLICVASSAGSVRTVELLLSAGADRYIRDSDGFLPIERAINGRSSRWHEVALLLAQDPLNLSPDDLLEHLVVVILGKCVGYFTPGDADAEAFRQGASFRVFVNDQEIGGATLQQNLDRLGIPLRLSPHGTDGGRVIEITMTPDGQAAFDCVVRWDVAPLSGSSKWGRLEQRYGYWLFRITQSADH